MKRALIPILAVTLLVCIATVGRAQEPIKIGLAAMISPKPTLNYYKSMLDYVGVEIGQPVQMIQKPTYDDMDIALEKGEVDIAFICAGPYVRDHDKFGVELLVAPVSYGQPFYYSYIIAPKDSPARSFSDLEGKRFAFTDPKSNTGKLVPTYLVSKRFGKSPDEFFSGTIYSRSHDKSIEAVAKRVVDGAAVDSLIYDYLSAKNPVYTRLTKIVEKSQPFGIPPVVVNKGLDPDLKAKLRSVFLEMHENPAGKVLLSHLLIDEFVVPKDESYDSVREMEDFLESLD